MALTLHRGDRRVSAVHSPRVRQQLRACQTLPSHIPDPVYGVYWRCALLPVLLAAAPGVFLQ